MSYHRANYNRGTDRIAYSNQGYSQSHHPKSYTSQGYNRQMNSSSNQGNKLYMGDLDYSWDEATIKEIWKQLGENDINIRMMWNNNVLNGRNVRTNLGYCFVEFPSEIDASNAILKNGMSIPNYPGRSLKLNWTTASTGGSNQSQPSHIRHATQDFSIFVGDLASNVTEAQLFELFVAQFPSTSSVKIVYDLLTSVSKGYGFIKFNDLNDQKRALSEMMGTFLNGRAIRVSTAGRNDGNNNQDVSRNKQETSNNEIHVNRPTSSNKGTSTVKSSQFIYMVQPQPELNEDTDPNNTTLFIGKLSRNICEEELFHFFSPFGAITNVTVISEKECGFVTYIDRSSAEEALSRLQNYSIRGSVITMELSRNPPQLMQIEDIYVKEKKNRYPPYISQPGLESATYGYTPKTQFQLDNATVQNMESILPLPGFTTLQYSDVLFIRNGNSLKLNSHSQPYAWNADTKPKTLVISTSDSNSFTGKLDASLARLESGSNGYLYT